MKTFIEQAQVYSQYHQNKVVFYLHLIGVPLIILAELIFLGFFQLIVPGVIGTTLASIAAVLLLVYYLRLNWLLALLFAPVLIFLLWISSLISYAGPTHFSLWSLFIIGLLGIACQLSGHIMVGKKPAFMDDFSQTLIAPLYLTAEVCFMLGRMQTLKEQIHGPDTIILVKPPTNLSE